MKTIKNSSLQVAVLSADEQALLRGGDKKWYVRKDGELYEVTQEEYKDIYASLKGEESEH